MTVHEEIEDHLWIAKIRAQKKDVHKNLCDKEIDVFHEDFSINSHESKNISDKKEKKCLKFVSSVVNSFLNI